MDEHVIDIGDYIRRRREESESRSTFAVWGAEGERSRFALPLWRIAYLAQGGRAAVAWEPSGRSDALAAMVGLDLRVDPPRTELEPSHVAPLRSVAEAPALERTMDDVLAIFLGERDARRWYLVVTDLEPADDPLGQEARNDICFLAGECAGLLFHRDLHRGAIPSPSDV